MLGIFKARASKKGIAATGEDRFRMVCRRLALLGIVAEQPYEKIESDLRIHTANTLLPRRWHGEEHVIAFIKGNLALVDGTWRPAVETIFAAADADLAGLIARETGMNLPKHTP